MYLFQFNDISQLWGMRGFRSIASLRRLLQSQGSCNPSYWSCTSWRRGVASHGGRQPPPADLAASSRMGEHSAPPSTQQQPQTPLCERSPEYCAELASLLAWRSRALAAIASVGDAWAQEDEGPSKADLETELSWLLDDAVAGLRAGPEEAVRHITWRLLERDLRSKVSAQELLQHSVQLRAPLEALDALWRQRMEVRAPLQYLTCAAHWRDMVLSVGPGVLIPRPETEQIVDFVAGAVAADPMLGQGPWADLGTGSGALAIGLARQLPGVPKVWAVDLNPAAVEYAAFNAQRLGVGDRVAVLQGSWYEPLRREGIEDLAGIVSNPPYVTTQEMERGLQAEVGRYEPRLALEGGPGLGVDSLIPICSGAVGMLQPGGFLALETGGGEQAAHVADVLRQLQVSQHSWEAGGSREGSRAFVNVRIRRDLFGVERFVTATRSRAEWRWD